MFGGCFWELINEVFILNQTSSYLKRLYFIRPTIMNNDIESIEKSFRQIKSVAKEFFNQVDSFVQTKTSESNDFSRNYDYIDWDELPENIKEKSHSIQKIVISTLGNLQKHIKLSSLLNEVDEIELITCLKSMRAGLRLKRYTYSAINVIHDEGMVLGVSPPSQSDSISLTSEDSRNEFFDNYKKVDDILDLIKVSPVSNTGNLSEYNRNIPTSYKPNTAFLIMRIAPEDDSVQDFYDAYVECFAKFGIKAIRADDIEHDEIITTRVMDEIKNSEYLLGDLTDQRPNVYYEVGFAHALRRNVILFKKKDSAVHFDLAAYNCLEYSGIRELKEKLIKRLEAMTNRKLPE